jgi:hypothetical protein
MAAASHGRLANRLMAVSTPFGSSQAQPAMTDGPRHRYVDPSIVFTVNKD